MPHLELTDAELATAATACRAMAYQEGERAKPLRRGVTSRCSQALRLLSFPAARIESDPMTVQDWLNALAVALPDVPLTPTSLVQVRTGRRRLFLHSFAACPVSVRFPYGRFHQFCD